MKLSALVSAIAGGFVIAGLLLAGVSLGLFQVNGVYPGSTSIENESLNLANLHYQHLGWRGTFATPDPVNQVWHWYVSEMEAQPEEGIGQGSPCHPLTARRRFLGFDYGISVSLCSERSGTRIVVVHNVSLRL